MATAAEPDDAVLFAGVSLVLGAACRHLFRGTRVPYTIALLVLGVALGSLEYGTKDGLGKLGAGMRIWANINPDLLLAAFLPALLFESAFSMEAHQIKKCMAQMLLLAGPGVLMSTFLLGTALKLTSPYDWNWETSLLLGGLLSATDPVAVVAVLKELGTSKKLSTIIEGESLMNDGVSVVVYQLFLQMVLGRSFNTGSILMFLSEVSLGAVALGLAFAIISLLWLGFTFNDTILEMTLTLAVSYIAFYTVQDALKYSGILTVTALGMFYAAFAKTTFKGDNRRSLHDFWEIVAYIANTIIFILSGVIIADGVLRHNVHFERHGTSWGFLLLLYFYVQMARAAVVGALYLLLRYFGYGLDFKEAIIIVWSGLRGAVSLSLALSVKRASDTAQPFLKPEVGTMVVCVLHWWHRVSDPDIEWFYHTIFVARTWYGQPVSNKGVQASYWAMLDEGRITQATANILMRSVDEAMDLVSSRPLCDWNSLQSNVYFPSYYRFLSASMLPQSFITYFTVQRLESGCYICAAFLRAHRIARRQLQDFLGDSEIAKIVIDESNAGGEEARKFLEEVRCTFPQLLCVLKTRQVTYAVLTHLSENVQNLWKTGLLEEKEMAHLDDAWQTDLKKLKRNPQLVKMPRVSDLLGAHPLVSMLPAAVRAPLLSNTKENVKGHGAALYMEGLRATGIWIVSIGAVKWRSQRLSSRHSLHPIFSHGSTLGLYEVLTGKSCLCDMITDSLVRCFFIEAEKIDQLRQSDPSVEAFLWQESAAVIAKLLIPRVFERMTMQETRLLVSTGSAMNLYTKGEDIILEHNYIGILLEGTLKAENQNNIVPPGVLLPSSMDLELLGLQSSEMNHMDSCSAANSYQVEAQAARVIIFEVGRLFTEANGQRNQPGGSFSAEALQLSMEESTGEEQVIITVDSTNKLPLGDSSSGVTRGS
ncbi:sodium/hydrogen exchanger 7 isoform X3 [Triticum aestivum]|uniref:sodium/hydrogen exchanger 7 isoform X3 n=1 Tax=Triticum aestivum TaxID=4565 RepID=UPI001D009245|nr:sodium/hydrogen exchanger 7-like isoform X3 [Triticum aestivum]